MLTDIEKLLFLLLALFALGASYAGFKEMFLIIGRGQGQLETDGVARRAFTALSVYLTQRTTLKTRPMTSVIHWGVVLGFTWYFLVNAVDLLIGFVPDMERQLQSAGPAYDGFRLLSDVLSMVVLLGIIYFLLRRLLLPNRSDLQFHDKVVLHSQVAAGAVKSTRSSSPFSSCRMLARVSWANQSPLPKPGTTATCPSLQPRLSFGRV